MSDIGRPMVRIASQAGRRDDDEEGGGWKLRNNLPADWKLLSRCAFVHGQRPFVILGFP